MPLDATISGTDSNSYLTIDEMTELMEGFSQMDVWDELGEDAQSQILLEATRLIDQYKAWGPVKVEGQALAFPRAMDAVDVIPKRIQSAMAEYVDYRLDGGMIGLKKLQSEGVTSTSILGMNSVFGNDPSRLPAGARQELDKLWETHWPTPTTSRDINGLSDADSFFG